MSDKIKDTQYSDMRFMLKRSSELSKMLEDMSVKTTSSQLKTEYEKLTASAINQQNLIIEFLEGENEIG